MLHGQLVSFENENYVYTKYLSRYDQYEFMKVQEDNSKDPEMAILSDLSKVEQIELQPGDEVRICKHNNDFLDLCYVDKMRKHEGEITKILREDIDDILTYKTYLLECTGSEFYWTANWFIPTKNFNNNNEYDDLLNDIYQSLGE